MNNEKLTNKQELVTPEEWKQFHKKLESMRRKIYASFSGNSWPKWFKTEERELMERLRANYKNSEYLAWHELVVGGTDVEISPKLDFPGEDSVELFFQNALDRIDKNS